MLGPTLAAQSNFTQRSWQIKGMREARARACQDETGRPSSATYFLGAAPPSSFFTSSCSPKRYVGVGVGVCERSRGKERLCTCAVSVWGGVCVWECLCATHCSTLQHTAAHCSTLQHTVTQCSTMQHAATCSNMLQHAATCCNALQRTATHCNELQHAAKHCNTLQHTATHCNTLQHTNLEESVALLLTIQLLFQQ